MKKTLALMLMIVCTDPAVAIEPETEVAISRVDCGRLEGLRAADYDDTVFDGGYRDMANPCYLVRHGDELILWDTGMPVGFKAGGGRTKAVGSKRGIREILAEHGISVEKIKIIAVSHNHFDHLGQAADFPHAKLLIGVDDWITMKNLPGSQAHHIALPPRATVQPWLDKEANVAPLIGDKDIFGDGTVMMITTPGHTPGHHSLLVRLKDGGPILLTGDLYELQETFESDAVPKYDINRADQLASYNRFKAIARKLKAQVIIQHEPGDLSKLPLFPKWFK